MKRPRGFTLVEILVALAILAIALAAIARASGLATDGARETRARLLATWAAGNRISELRARRLYPSPAVSTTPVEQGGLAFVIRETVEDTPNPAIRRLELAVTDAADPGRVLATQTAFLARP